MPNRGLKAPSCGRRPRLSRPYTGVTGESAAGTPVSPLGVGTCAPTGLGHTRTTVPGSPPRESHNGTIPIAVALGNLNAPKARPCTCSSSCLPLPISGLSPTPSFHALAPAQPKPARDPWPPIFLPDSRQLWWKKMKPQPGRDQTSPGPSSHARLPARFSGQPFLRLPPQNLPGLPRPVLPLTLLPLLLSLPRTLSPFPGYTGLALQHPALAFLQFNPTCFSKTLLSVPLGSKLKALWFLFSEDEVVRGSGEAWLDSVWGLHPGMIPWCLWVSPARLEAL